MPNQVRSETFKNVESLTKKIEGLQFDRTIDFYQNLDATLKPITNSPQEQWFGGVLAPNGKIYGLPGGGNSTAYIIELDPNTDSHSLIPITNSPEELWYGGVVAPNGKIYGLPSAGNSTAYILEFDPNTGSHRLISFTNQPLDPTQGNYEQWNGGVLAPNGKIYGLPSAQNSTAYILEFDPNTDSHRLIPFTNLPSGSTQGNYEQWNGGVLAPNGKIYGLPTAGNSTAYILEFDPNTDSHSLIPITNLPKELWFGGVLAPNGKIYGLPFGGNSTAYILEFDPNTISNSNHPNLIHFPNRSISFTGVYEYFYGGTLAPNGKIYGIPGGRFSKAYILELDPNTISNSNPPNLIEFTNKPDGAVEDNYEEWFGGVLAPNGKIYGLPSTGNPTSYILEFRRTFPQLMTDWILYPQFNKF